MLRQDVAEQLNSRHSRNQPKLRRRRVFGLDMIWNLNFTHRRTHYDKRRRPGSRMPLDPSPLRPCVGGVMVIDVTQQQARIRLVYNHTDIASGANRPKVRVFAATDAMKLHPWTDRVNLQIKGCCLDRSLLITSQASETIGERI